MKTVLLGLLLFSGSVRAQVFQFLYLEASEGNSSGGHVAVQFGDDVYHYQYENTLIRLFKHGIKAFRVNYQLQQNRSIHAAGIEVSDSTYEHLNHYFKKQYFEQTQQLKQLQAVQHNQALLRALLHGKADEAIVPTSKDELLPQLQGAGLFYPEGNLPASIKTTAECDTKQASNKIIAKLKLQLENQHSKDFLSHKIHTVNEELNQLLPVVITDVSVPHYSYSEHYSDLLNGLLALQVLQKSTPLMHNACFQVNSRLDDLAVRQATAFQYDLLRSAKALILSKRPDWGYALFVTLARLIVIEQSIQTGYWTFLNDIDDKISPVSGQQLALYTQQLQKQRRTDLKRMQQAYFDLASSASYERRYVQLEMAVNRYQQWLNSEQTGSLSYQSEQPLPRKNIPLNFFLSTDVPTEQLKIALIQQQMAAERLIKEDNARNSYHLVTKNCVTALFALINEAVSGQSTQLLGGFIDPQQTFIPFQAYDVVQESYNIISTEDFPAYRRYALTKMYHREVDSWVYARESNIFSSSLYNHNPEDAWFVFFTDDTMLFRPVFGAVNILAATSQSLFGTVSWPFDEGKALKSGVRGILASLPELIFFNIRKGSYPYPIEP